ncbi:MAG: hypothetical protein LBU66_08530 [Treponema sp.]|jgi:hypothetical protein|nr:hypothetical protein [Treponema sp.]
MYGIIYKATGPTGLVYIGQTIKSLAKRKAGHKCSALRQDRRGAFQVALLEYGFKSFAWEQIDQAGDKVSLDQKEKYWIAQYKANDPAFGYNNTEGGDGFTPTTETRRKISIANKGKKRTSEQRQKMSEARKGTKGDKHTPETRLKLSEMKKGKPNGWKGKKLTSEHRENLRKAWVIRRKKMLISSSLKTREGRGATPANPKNNMEDCMGFVVKDYATAREHKERLKRNNAWEKTNNYERFNFCLCLHCAYFSINHDLPIAGDCSLKDKEGVYEGVLSDSVCDRFISCKGTDINGKKLDPALLSMAFQIERMKDGSVYIPRQGAA